MPNDIKCPHCGGKESDCIYARGSEYADLIINKFGAVSLWLCLNCGTVYIPKWICERISNRRADNG